MSATEVLMPESRQMFVAKGNEESERKSGLSKLGLLTAETELSETSSGKEQALAILKDWVKKHPQLINVRLDDNFLLRFLRVKKYNVPMAEHILVKYLNFRRSIPDFYFNLDYTEGKVAELIDSGYIFASPFRDAHGRRVIIYIAEKLDTTKFTKVEMAKAHAITYETLLEDEENQVMGLTHFGDVKSISMSHVALWNPFEMAVCLKIGEMHNSVEDLHKHLDRRCLPKEYGGVVPMAEMIEMWKKELAASRSRLLGLDTMKSLVPIKRRTKVEEMTGSFKKLEVD